MGQFKLKIEELAQKHLKQHYRSGDKGNIKKIEKILLELSQTPYTGTGSPEQLKYELTGFWSRRINQKDRLIYKVEEGIVTVFVVSAMGHYHSK
ncbi:Txe/YoeB family addiction module toxin [Mucilaginibacter phyllosphaerae]|uniref:Putative mRNA interferase YoeB n=1 Tax=Mucilaginibacter phyllosphaerae TaxID=1812349 RepID=A0A4Y8AHT8_9SPHI|nr:Txe/YoeB family addiction module toxin [Mucilaginibacter phyllosphaerae]MBB3968674.1 toxin YoeB [Mucilaginibacter phyllosphaerae]TEW67689.1 Txe/YoeB family addiction module toxin [Mucilaginibacter phyllosphaerae]GGH14570.1 Txe/YoeB family addiction module toxin [Mucilaginibacter phyllosphaerae]